VWTDFNRIEENNNDCSKNCIIIDNNSIVIERLRKEFEDMRMFREDHILTDDCHYNKKWKDDFYSIAISVKA